MNRTKERGVALILAMILLLVLSVMAVSLMFLSQTETWSGMNYRLMSQARDGAEAGVNKAANFLLNSYTPPGTAGDPLSNYTAGVAPVPGTTLYAGVTYGGSPVLLSANGAVSSNYPIASVQTSFNTAGQGSLTAGTTTVNYAASATLLSQQQVTVYGSSTPATIQTWLITSDGSISNIRNAQVEVSAIMERQITPVFNYAAFADSSGCSALSLSGGGSVNSYDSSAVVNGTVTTQNYGGNVGTNGNLSESGSTTDIYGSLSTPRTGVGTCNANNVTALTVSGNAKLTGGLIELPQPVNYPNPTIPSPGTTNLSLTKNWSCPTGLNAIPGCSSSGGDITIPPGSYGDLNISGGANVHLSAGAYNINSLTESGGSTIIIDSGPVILNVAGNGINSNSKAVDLSGGSVTNASLLPTNFQIMYAGTAKVALSGGGQASGLVYAPNSSLAFSGGSNWYGAVIGGIITDTGGTAIHYDRRLQNTAYTLGNYMLSSFTWKKY
jgi:Tfp pilus assembly protein PilX